MFNLRMGPTTPLLAFFFFFLRHLLLPSSAEGKEIPRPHNCTQFPCGKLGMIGFPFSNISRPDCGVFTLNCSEEQDPKIQFKKGGGWYGVKNINQPDLSSFVVLEKTLPFYWNHSKDRCKLINDFSAPTPNISLLFSSYNFTAEKLFTLYNCSHNVSITPSLLDVDKTSCQGDYDIYCNTQNISFPFKQQCPIITLPFSHPPPPPYPYPHQLIFQVEINRDCFKCRFFNGGKCYNDKDNKFRCLLHSKGKKKRKLIIGIIAGLGSGVLLTTIVLGIIMWRRKHKPATSRNIPDPYLNVDDPEGASGHLGVLVFSYKDLTEATNNFDAEKELGDGGFGAVYHGVLKDGREVAVKRLYEHNYKRVEQFVNEIKILTLLRHKNLVSLYGCTSHRSRELLLVYEYIPNGTVADHLHGDQAITSPLTWSIRLSIAIETASALAYLHASDIVHRDVKTNNILLDNNFSVKVADFGLSRLFPNDVTHVSTAPQGTPGYVDPEYHQCYQLTSKSDVYSFGVVLVELLSSMPAVDITRHRHEINLSNLAISKIQKRAYNELIDQQLGFASDIEVRTMTIAVAELAFECLQQDKEMRPTMDEVLERLRRIEDGKIETQPPPPQPSPECGDEVGLLKNMKHDQHSPSSPNAVTEAWPSTTSTTPNFSA
ncbi:LEAF RUST 10 DISEASE-RESISTANCE LOCUS RECEPTOR-LIKE PROTEIN KINASE-like 1.1 isoform X3 [Cannabis sativa]|uniref:LEAF RUST 10 DISEASE-RESISTANCE LOCUS RECEPTOR-LIKE PROTEIN KINASE-like 1.1 isoform X3 n=1 Tax=Cannabis sativa TaxID=3483 RepID=UPI0029CA4864|nr:LEAF RUST 10 DISEASE-RESISTANCE LOCUS RECEPTOR-LIKE PROTEIN KINASE-like 1.1 isoform X3 [Cannabis sativa]